MIKFKYLKLVIYLLLLLLGQSCSNHQLLSITSRRKRPYNHANHESDKKKGRSEEKEQNIAGFSKWTPKMFNDQFHIDFKIENIESFKPEKEIINKDNLEFIIKSFKRIIETRGGFTNIEGKEATFSNYPNILITEMVHEVSQERVSNNKSKIFLSDQYTYGGTMAKGDVDLVVRIKSSPNYSDNILFVTEVKKPSTLEDGLLQNCMELYTAYEQNSIKEDVYGVVTCGNLWIFTRYVGLNNNEYPIKNWNQSRCFTISIPNDIEDFSDKTKEEVEEIASYIKWIIKSSADEFDKAISHIPHQKMQILQLFYN